MQSVIPSYPIPLQITHTRRWILRRIDRHRPRYCAIEKDRYSETLKETNFS